MRELKLKGYSNFNVNMMSDLFADYVVKVANNESDYNKLKRQIIKQINFDCNNKKIKIPRVIDNVDNGFVMEYINEFAFYEYFQSQENVYRFFNIITTFIDGNIKKSTMKTFNKEFEEKIISKYTEILNNSINHKRLEEINRYHTYLINFIDKNKIILPEGQSHGDLTLSNIIFARKELYLIDFLDNFIETPFQDIIKLRQDTQFNWSYELNKKIIDDKLNEGEVNILRHNLKLLDTLLESYYKYDEVYYTYYNFYQIFNFFRILPYSKDERELEWILNMMREIEMN